MNSVAAKGIVGEEQAGPLFHRFDQIIDELSSQEDAELRTYATETAQLTVRQAGGAAQEFSADFVRAVSQSCLGPYFVDEERTWVQLSWVCRTDGDAALAKYLTFRDSPELALTVWFEAGLIKTIHAGEPIPVPGQRRVSMNGYQLLGGSQ